MTDGQSAVGYGPAMLLLLLACTPDPSVIRVPVSTLTGEATWAVDFDEASEAEGFADCSYTRAFDGIEDRSVPWLCPECESMYRLDVELVSGDACSTLVSPDGIDTLEWHGASTDQWLRGSENVLLSEQGSVVAGPDGLGWTNETEWLQLGDATVRFTVDGFFTEGRGKGDPWHGGAPHEGKYLCGWPDAEPPAWEGPWTVEVGQTLPDGWLRDQCLENLRLHDFSGRWLVIDVSAMDCPPCQDMAAGERAFIETLAREGVDLEVVTLLAPSLSDPLGQTSLSMQLEWVSAFQLQSPVLADRGWGAWVLGAALGQDFAYPAWAVVSPDLEVVAVGTGFGGWDLFRPYLGAQGR